MLIEQTVAWISAGALHQHVQFPVDKDDRPRVDDLVTKGLSLPSALAQHGLEIYINQPIDEQMANIFAPFSTISPTNTFENPATIWATGCDTCRPMVC